MEKREEESTHSDDIPFREGFYRVTHGEYRYIRKALRVYACGKCSAKFSNQKKLKEHRFEVHSY